MIRETLLSTAMTNEDDLTEPPSGMLKLSMIGDMAYLDWAPTDQVGEWITPPTCSFQVPARSLLLALRAAWDDSKPGTAAIDPTHPSSPARTTTEPRPSNNHQPWTPELDGQLRDTWLAAATSVRAPDMVDAIAQAMGRSPNGIRARLVRVGCNPDVPGGTAQDAPQQESSDP